MEQTGIGLLGLRYLPSPPPPLWKEGNCKVVCPLINGKYEVAWVMERTVAKRQRIWVLGLVKMTVVKLTSEPHSYILNGTNNFCCLWGCCEDQMRQFVNKFKVIFRSLDKICCIPGELQYICKEKQLSHFPKYLVVYYLPIQNLIFIKFY